MVNSLFIAGAPNKPVNTLSNSTGWVQTILRWQVITCAIKQYSVSKENDSILLYSRAFHGSIWDPSQIDPWKAGDYCLKANKLLCTAGITMYDYNI